MITDPQIDAVSRILVDSQRRDDVCELVERHGFDRNRVFSVTYNVVDIPMLEISVYLYDDVHDRIQWVNGEPVRETVDVALRGELPSWWRPGGGGAT